MLHPLKLREVALAEMLPQTPSPRKLWQLLIVGVQWWDGARFELLGCGLIRIIAYLLLLKR